MKTKSTVRGKGIILVDPEKCLACRTCELSCAVEHSESKSLSGADYQKTLPRPRVKVESTPELTMPMQCRHCEDAPCVQVCPTKAIERTDPEGPVLIKEELCIGCKWCVLVCPFGSISMGGKDKAPTKCDLCFERLQRGEYPACVTACPTKALQFKSIEEIAAQKRKDYLVKFKKDKTIV